MLFKKYLIATKNGDSIGEYQRYHKFEILSVASEKSATNRFKGMLAKAQ